MHYALLPHITLILFRKCFILISDEECLEPGSQRQYSLVDFELIRVIGRGSYAKVLMVELKKTHRIYAMKVIKKALVTDDEVSRLSWLLELMSVQFIKSDSSSAHRSTRPLSLHKYKLAEMSLCLHSSCIPMSHFVYSSLLFCSSLLPLFFFKICSYHISPLRRRCV